MISARSIVAVAVFVICGLWGSVAFYVMPIALVFLARDSGPSLGIYLFVVGNVVLPFTLMAIAFRMRRPRTPDA
ncbi:MAG: hypothetical protein ACJASD_001194 [Sphingomonas echinoides]